MNSDTQTREQDIASREHRIEVMQKHLDDCRAQQFNDGRPVFSDGVLASMQAQIDEAQAIVDQMLAGA